MHFPDYSNQAVICIASGPTANLIDPQWLRNHAVIAVNNSYQLVPATHRNAALYAADPGWWAYYKDARRFPGWKFACAFQIRNLANDVVVFRVARRRSGLDRDTMVKESNPLIIGHGSHGGFQAVNIALNFGAKIIGLVGYDYRHIEDKRHWHDDHPIALRNPCEETLSAWAMRLDRQRKLFDEWGVKVLNLSPVSRLKAYDYVDCDTFDKIAAPLSTGSISSRLVG